MITTIPTNGLSSKAIYRLFPMVHTIHTDGTTASLVHDDPIIYPADAEVTEALREDARDVLREIREPLLVDADWMVQRAEDQGGDVSAWRAYRQALRDVTAQPDPLNVVWPTKPQIGDDTAQPIG
jgi:hypothetical protein